MTANKITKLLATRRKCRKSFTGYPCWCENANISGWQQFRIGHDIMLVKIFLSQDRAGMTDTCRKINSFHGKVYRRKLAIWSAVVPMTYRLGVRTRFFVFQSGV